MSDVNDGIPKTGRLAGREELLRVGGAALAAETSRQTEAAATVGANQRRL